MKSVLKYILVPFIALAAVSCHFDDTMSYPRIVAEFVSFEVEGQVGETVIDRTNRVVRVVIDEDTDLNSVRVICDSLRLNELASFVEPLPDVLDLTKPYVTTLRIYQDYKWTIVAEQPVERYVHIRNQIGEAEIDPVNRIALVAAIESQSLENIEFLDMKLERNGSRIVGTQGYTLVGDESVLTEAEITTFPVTLECVMLRYFDVEYRGETIRWTVKVVNRAVSLEVDNVNAWAYKAQIQALYDGTGSPYLEYRKAADAEWIRIEDAVIEGIGISAELTGLEPGTGYVARVVNGDETSFEYGFTTETPDQLYNLSFDDWWLDGKVWYPYAQGADPTVWDSANKGAATFIGSSTTPEEQDVISGKALRMESKYAVIAFAAGNIYTGKFGQISGVGAILDWGTPFSSRPSGLKGYYKYTPKPINRVKAPYENMKGQMDKCQIQIFLTDWDDTFEINTTAGKFVDFANDEHIIAYGKIETDQPTDGYVEFNLPLEYRDKHRKPKYIVISCCSSYLGDYFTGGEGSVMLIDEFELLYE